MFKMQARSVLKDLQVSATNKNILVGSPVTKITPPSKLTPIYKKCFQAAKEKTKVPKRVLEKENGKTGRFSKRKNEKPEKLSKISKSEVKSSLKPDKDVTSKATKANVATASNHFEVDSLQSSSTCLDDKLSTKFDITNVTVNQNVSDITATVTSPDSRSCSYWQDLAEQRRIALEKSLFENEQLFDQVTVLQTENSFLKEALNSAEKLLKMEGILE